MELTRQPLSRRGFLQVSAATVGAAALAGVLPRSLLAQDDGGFAVIDRSWSAGDSVELELPMPARRVTAHPSVENNAGRMAVQVGAHYLEKEQDKGLLSCGAQAF